MLLRYKDKLKLIEIFSSVPEVFEVWAYGSRVNGDAHAGSDLDLAIRNINTEPIKNELLLDLKEKIHDSTIPILVELRDWARLPERFQRNIESKHEILFPQPLFSLNEPDVSYNDKSTSDDFNLR
jgi:predicted nucleotidyltransferase